jgi:CubicO group peptidase (beta-lactamase class C family)
VAVVHDGRFFFSRGYGSANLDYGVPIDGRSVFYLASVSKQFTAAAVALAAAEDRLAIDGEVQRWIPELPEYGTPITVRQLVHHTSGLRDYLTLIPLSGRRADDHWTDAALLDLIARQRATNFTPGAEFLYSNTGYVLLAEIVGRATNSSLRRYADARIFRPLGMHDTHFHDDAGAVVPRRVIGYDRNADGSFRLNHWFAFNKVGDGGLYSSAEDLAHWEENFHEGGLGGAPFLAQMHQRGVLTSGDTVPYAFGLTHGSYRGLRTVSHGGGLAGFRTMILRFPDQRFSSIVLCNTSVANAGLLAQRTSEVFLGAAMSAPVVSSPASAAAAPQRAGSGGTLAAEEYDIAHCAGQFHSDELDPTYTLLVENGALVLRLGPVSRIELQAAAPFVFAAATGLVLRFDADASTFTIDAGRVRGIQFKRTPDS